MTKLQVLARLKEMGIAGSTISFYSKIENGESVEVEDTFFGDCEISGECGDIVQCVALAEDLKTIVHFQAGTWMVPGHLGKIAGAF